jgi:uncharacterized SAM-binding protein YcdF (DUF218 family)
LIAALGGYAFVRLGRFMSPQDPLEKADVIFVFAGTLVERPLEAADLYREGYAPRIVITRAVAEQATFSLQRRGVRFPTEADLNREVLLGVGVPAAAIIEPERIHDNTAEELQTLRALIAQYHWHRVILVSSMYHLRRIKFGAWRELRGTGVQLVLHGSRYDPARPDRWWQHRQDIRWLLTEVPKLAAYLVGLGA